MYIARLLLQPPRHSCKVEILLPARIIAAVTVTRAAQIPHRPLLLRQVR